MSGSGGGRPARDGAHPDVAVLLHARSAGEAQVVAALLRAADIPVWVGGRRLADEFAVSQALLGLSQVEVEVPADRLEEARALLAEAREQGRADDPDA